MSSRVKWLLIISAVLINVAVIWFLRNSSKTNASLESKAKNQSASNEPRYLARGATVQRNRIVEFTEKVQRRSLLELEKSLADKEFTVQSAGSLPTLTDTYCYFNAFFADRRVAKIYAEYSQMPKDDANDRAIALFETWMKEHTERLGRIVKGYEKLGGYEDGVGLRESNYACAASVFLMTRFCELSKFDFRTFCCRREF